MTQIHYADGEDKTTPIVLTDNSTQLVADGATATQSGVISESGGSHGLEKTGAFLEHATVFDHRYGTPWEPVHVALA